MSLDTQNNLTNEEVQLIETIAGKLRKAREHEYASNLVRKKIASTNFQQIGRTPLPKLRKAIYIGGALLITTFIVFFIVNNLSQNDKNIQTYQQVKPEDVNTNSITFGRKDSFNIADKDNKSTIEQNDRNSETSLKQGPTAVVGLATNAKSAISSGEALSFFEEFKFDRNADIKKFKNDLKITLERTDFSFIEKKSKDEVISFETDNIKGITNTKIPVDFFISAKVDKRFPGSLKISLRYIHENGRTSYLKGESIETIFYERLRARVTGLIDWKYKSK
jgi:hypothetical protein